jgi:colicin import membrane protein
VREPKNIKSDFRSWLYSLILHGVVLALIIVGIGFGAHSISAPSGTGADKQVKTVKAHVVSQKMIDQQLASIKAAEAKKKAARQAAKKKRQQKIAAARKERKQEQARLAKLKAEHQAAQKAAAARAAKQKREEAQEQKHLAKLKARREAAAKKAAATKAKAEAARKKAAKAKAARKKAAAERARKKAEAKKKAAEERARKKAAAAKAAAQRKANLKQELAAEQKQREQAAKAAKHKHALSRERGLYESGLRQAIHQAWNPPPSMKSNMECNVGVTLVPPNDVVNAEIQSPCNASDAVKQSITNAVYRASLPKPSDPELFERQITVTFKPSNAEGSSQ